MSENVVYNHDVAGFYRRVNRFIEELVKAQSSGGSQILDADIARLDSYLQSIVTYRDWVVAQPQLDLPETHPRAYPLDDVPAIPELENESIMDLIRLFVLQRDELVNSQSARLGSGLIGFDDVRLMALVQKGQSFLTNYVKTTTPLDLPESSPSASMTGPGRGGV